ncbi:MAG: oxygen-independent coproporphyrinogen III oxidase [Alphaproteobacteria bacterium]
MSEYCQLPPEEIINKYGDRKGSFYTYYPMTGQWNEGIGPDNFIDGLTDLMDNRSTDPVSLYLHFPFCMKQCIFCQCFTVISGDQTAHGKFISYMLREIDMLKKVFKEHSYVPNVREVHFGGGSPSIIQPEDFKRLTKALCDISGIDSLSELDEVTIEIDPRYDVSKEKMRFYHDQGINRISFGVQDFNPKIGKIMNRVNPADMIESILTDDVRAMFKSINFDFIYGLPEQTQESFKESIDAAIRLQPDRMAVCVLGHRPDVFRHQNAFEKYSFADTREKTKMFVDTVNSLGQAGYDHIGIDYFSKKTDDLSVAKNEGTLFRNAQGYTPGRSIDLIGIGPSAMGIIGEYYFQNYYTLPEYYEHIDAGKFPVVRGWKASEDDMMRREVMFDFILFDAIDKAKFNDNYDIDFDSYFSVEMEELADFIDDGLIEDTDGMIRMTENGRLYQRQVCSLFDVYVRAGKTYKHSREFENGRKGFNREVQVKRA